MPNEKRARHKASRRAKLEAERRAAQRQRLIRRVAIVAVGALVIIGSVAIFANSNSKSTPSSTTLHGLTQAQTNDIAHQAGCPTSPTQPANTLTWASAPPMTINPALPYYAHILTTQGPIVIKLDPTKAPVTVNNFVFLAKNKFYDCVTFHRVIPEFAIQGGDPTGTGSGGPGYSVKDELPPLGHPTYPLYSVAMANSGPNTNGSQFFIVTGSSGEALAPNYSLFGQVVSGTRALTFIDQQGGTQANNGVPPAVINRMLNVTITQKP